MSYQDKEKVWHCSICNLSFPSAVLAGSCEKAHEIVYVPMKRTDIDKLIQYIFSGGKADLPDELVNSLMSFTRVKEHTNDKDLY